MYWLTAILILPYLFLFLKIYRNLLKIKSFKASTIPSTHVSVIISCRNEQENLPVLLDCIVSQDYPQELFEVLIVDDNSTDKTFEAASENDGLVKILILKNKGKGKKHAIRTGIDAASGRLIITTDADCRMGKSWIKTIAAFYEKHRPDMIICPVQLNAGKGFFGRFQELEYLSLQGITAGTAMAGNGIMCNGANLAFTREAYLNNKDKLHFELATGDDIFLLHSLKKEPHSKIVWLESTEAAVTTASSSTISSFLRQRKRWISKWKAYSDRFTILTGIFTFSATLLQLSVLVSVVVNISFVEQFITILILKSVPDFLILQNTAARYGRKLLMLWFLPIQLIYPVYVMGVFLFSLIQIPRRED
jgi:poly-beta-1,6-N-acetyl-D-glucosamine synthase